jgi:hypothetical protein
MRALWFIALFVGLGSNFSSGQQSSSFAPSNVANAQPVKVKVHNVGML